MKSMFALVFIALIGCASEWHCPNAPKAVAMFSVGERVAWAYTINQVVKGEIGVIVDIEYAGDWVIYAVKCDKDGHIRSSFQTPDTTSIEALVYPDPALAPRK